MYLIFSLEINLLVFCSKDYILNEYNYHVLYTNHAPSWIIWNTV